MRKENRAAAGAAAWQVIQNTDSRISVWQRLAAVPRMLWSGLRGRYPELGRSKLIGMLLMAAYIVSPIDFVPELFIPLLGLADDVGIAVWLATMALGESERFLEWERRNQAQQAFQQANPDPRAGQPQEGHAPGAGRR